MTRFVIASALLLTFATPAVAAEPLFEDKRLTFGAMRAPAQLPAGALALYGFVGAPEVGLGLRQGLRPLELELVARVDYLAVSFAGEALLRKRLFKAANAELAPFLGLGLVGNTGAKYVDALNYGYFGARARGGVLGTLRLGEIVYGIAELDLAFDRQLERANGWRFAPRAAAGVEVYLTNDVSLTGRVSGGLDLIKDPAMSTVSTRGALGLQLGAGFRLF